MKSDKLKREAAEREEPADSAPSIGIIRTGTKGFSQPALRQVPLHERAV